MFLLTSVSDKLTQEKARWRPSCKRSLICLMFREGPMCQSAQIWQGASKYDIELQQSTTDPSTPYPATLSAWLRGSSWTWPQFSTLLSPEFGLVRCTRIGSRRFENIQSNPSIFHYLQGDEHAGSESQRAGGDWHPKPRRQVETILLTQNGVKRPKCNILCHEIMYQGQLDLLSWLLPDRVGQDAQPNRGGGVSQYVAQLDHHHPETIAIC